MLTAKEYIQELDNRKHILNIESGNIQQGSDDWLKIKLGVVSASNITKVLAAKTTQGRKTYMSDLIAQVCTGIMPEIKAKPLQWGRDNEAAARTAYEFATGNEIEEVPFIFMGDGCSAGISPDGLIKDQNKGLELKCPFSTTTHIDFLMNDKIKKEYVNQCQFSMWLTDADEWDFASYDPRMRSQMIHIKTIVRDEKIMKEFDEKVPEFISEMGMMLLKRGFIFGEQWASQA